MENRELIKKALLIRRFEEKMLSLFSEGELSGTIHTCIGQEWTGVAAANAIEEGDCVFSNHRGHGHFPVKTAILNKNREKSTEKKNFVYYLLKE